MYMCTEQQVRLSSTYILVCYVEIASLVGVYNIPVIIAMNMSWYCVFYGA